MDAFVKKACGDILSFRQNYNGCAPSEVAKASAEEKKLEFEQLAAMATWQAEQRRAAAQGRAMKPDDAEACFLKDPAEWPAGRTQFTVVLWKARHGREWQNNLTPVRLRDLTNDANRMVPS